MTFLFTDIEGSTELWERDPGSMRSALARHDEILRHAIEERGGNVFKTVGDAFHAVFSSAEAAVEAAVEAQRALQAEPWSTPEPFAVRMALHCGGAELREGDYYGPPLNRTARMVDAGHGGQILLSRAIERRVGERFPEGAALRDLGERRLKDLTEPERIFQLVVDGLRADFPPLRTLDARPHNLPARTSSLVGREEEIARVRSLLLDEDARLVTLIGPGGTGKTRLGIQAAAEVIDRYRDGAWLVDLASVREPELVAGEILRIRDARPEADETEVDALRRHLRDREMLLVLDNFEQVVEAAPLVAELLEAAPGLTILVTSQAALRIRGEREVSVPPLAVPDPGEEDPDRLLGSEAVALFDQRARAAVPSFRLSEENAAAVRDICLLLDGLPLAIELAAARVKLFAPKALLRRLEESFDVLATGGRDLPERQRTLRGALEWSYDLLAETEAALFRRQAVFAGGFTLEAAESVCTTPEDELDVLDALTSLLDKSLLRRVETDGAPRFERLRTIRAFAVEKLEESGEADRWRGRHAGHFAVFADRIDYGGSEGRGTREWLERLDRELDNLRAAMEWALERGEAGIAPRICAILPAVWFLRGVGEEGRRWLERTLALEDSLEARGRARVLNLIGRLGQVEGDNSPEVVARFEESLEIYREVGDRSGEARALMNLGNVRRRLEAFEQARGLFEESLGIYRGIGDHFGVCSALMNLGDLANARGDVERARELFAEARDTARAGENPIALAYALQYLGQVALETDELERAADLFEESRAIFEDLGSEPGTAWSDYYLATVARERGDRRRARSRYLEALECFRDVEYPPGIAACLLGYATLDAEAGRCERAARLLGAARAIRARATTSVSPIETEAARLVERACREALGEGAFGRLQGEGAEMSPAGAIALAASTGEGVPSGEGRG
ncbi:MAG: tetratricopeptide repeat protein [Gemmatimonadota bacterium]|nr:tetratricopeptide repeat protein [Gemmatimonadota bacterium]